jgi:hypothetical protein
MPEVRSCWGTINQIERDLFSAQKLLTTVRIISGEPATRVRKVSPRCSMESVELLFIQDLIQSLIKRMEAIALS